MKKVFYVLQLCLIILCGCDNDSDGGANGGKGFAPGEIIGKILTLQKNDGEIYLSTEHLSASNVLVTSKSDEMIDYGEYPPSYEYSVTGDNKASYYLVVTRKVATSPSSVYYSMFIFDIELSFISTSKGTYQGIQKSGNGKESIITGRFTLVDKDAPSSSEEDEDERGILLSTPTVSEITVSSAHIEGNIVATDVSVQEQGVCYGINSLPTLNDNYKSSKTSNVSVDLEGLTENTSYNVRLYAKVDGNVQYGKTAQFTTKEEKKDEGNASTIKAVITMYELNCNTQEQTITFHGERGEIAKDKTLSIGFCASTSPEPKITDISFSETTIKPYNNSGDRTLTGAKAGTTYYIRPYHVANGKVIYYGGASGQTIGRDIKIGITFDYTSSKKLNGYLVEYEDVKVTYSYEIAPEGTYKITFERYSPGMTNPGPFETHVGYVKKGKYEYVYSAGIAYNRTRYTIQIECVDTGVIYKARFTE